MPVSNRWRAAAALSLLTVSILLTGCGGGGAIGNTSTARLRSLDAAVNPGNTADILVNGAANYGDQTYFGAANNLIASPYNYIGPQNGVALSYYLPNQTLPSGAAASSNTGNITTDNYYTAVLIGSYSANYAATPTDPRVLQTVLLPPRSAPTANSATLRVMNAAPDIGFSSVLNGTTSSYTIGSVTIAIGSPAVTTFSSITYGTVSLYQTLPPGTYPVTVTQLGSGGGPVTTTTTSITVAGNTVYTLYLTEPTASPLTYDLKLLPD